MGAGSLCCLSATACLFVCLHMPSHIRSFILPLARTETTIRSLVRCCFPPCICVTVCSPLSVATAPFLSSEVSHLCACACTICMTLSVYAHLAFNVFPFACLSAYLCVSQPMPISVRPKIYTLVDQWCRTK